MRHLKSFHVFHIAASSSSFSEAAKKLCITHGAVSKQIKTLENYLEQSLFYREGRNVRLTHEGEILKDYTEQAFHALDSGVKKISKVKSSCIDVSCEPTLTMRWLMPRLADFYEENPKADVRLSTAGGPVKLDSTGISLAIRRDDFDLSSNYNKTILVDEWVGPVFSPEYWQKVIDNLSEIKLLHSQTRPRAWADWIDKSVNVESVDSLNFTKFTENASQKFAHFYFCFQAAIDGLGAAIGSYPLVADDVKRGNLIAPFGFVLSGHRYILLSQKNKPDIELETKFTQWLQLTLSEYVPNNQKLLYKD